MTQIVKGKPQLPAALSRLVDEADAYADRAQSDNTARAYNNAWKDFEGFAKGQGLIAAPADPETVRVYLVARDHLATTTLRQRLAAITAVHKKWSMPNPVTSEVAETMAGIARAKQHKPKQAKALTAIDAEIIRRTVSDTLADKRNLAMLLVARSGLFRRSELVALNVEDMELPSEGVGSAFLAQSKTDQEGQGSHRALTEAAVQAVRDWLLTAGIKSGAVFQGIDNGDNLTGRLSDQGVARAFKKIAAKAGIDAKDISGHSCRVGTAQDLVANGAELNELMQAGGWKSAAMPARYAEKAGAKRGAVARLLEV